MFQAAGECTMLLFCQTPVEHDSRDARRASQWTVRPVGGGDGWRGASDSLVHALVALSMRSGNVQAIGTHDQRHYGTVTVVLVATNVYVALKSRTQYVPVAGNVNATVALGMPAAGRVWKPFRYSHCSTAPVVS